MSLELRDVAPTDDQYLIELYSSTREAELAATPWTDTQKQEFVLMQFEAQRTDYETRFPNAAHSIMVMGDRDVGRIWIDRRSEEIRLLDITVHPDVRNRRIGSTAIGLLQAESAVSAIPLRHSVYVSNDAALRFYRRHGFTVIEDFETYVLMEWLPETLRDE